MTEAALRARLPSDAARVAAAALAEDGDDDITSRVTITAAQTGRAQIEARAPVILAGLLYADAVVAAVGLPAIEWKAVEGTAFDRPAVVGTIAGPLGAILKAERPLLNLLQRATGIATLTARCVAAVAGTGCRILHTRKTTPGLRSFEVSAVLAGGGALHRLDLARAVMIKDNHWQGLAASGRSLADALDLARQLGVTQLQVEVESQAQLDEACDAGATRLLIDNQPVAILTEWVRRARARSPGIELEATGGITLEGLPRYAATGVDYISAGMLTHSVPSADLGLELVSRG